MTIGLKMIDEIEAEDEDYLQSSLNSLFEYGKEAAETVESFIPDSWREKALIGMVSGLSIFASMAPEADAQEAYDQVRSPQQQVIRTVEDENEDNSLDIQRHNTDLNITRNITEEEVIDTDEISSVYLSATEFLHEGADEIIVSDNPEEQSAENRLWRSLATAPVLAGLEFTLSQAAHEYGHFRGFSKAGMTDFQFSRMDGSNRRSANPLNAFTTRIDQLFGRKTVATVSQEDWKGFLKDPERSQHSSKYLAMMEAGGINIQQYSADQISDQIREGDAHVLQGPTYAINAFGGSLYTTSDGKDIHDYVRYMEDLGIDTSQQELVLAELSQLLSNSTISFAKEIPEYLKTGEGRIEPLGIGLDDNTALMLPEFSSYLTTEGPTIRYEQRLRSKGEEKDSVLNLSVESALSGDGTDFGVGYRRELSENLEIGGNAAYNPSKGGAWVEIDAEYDAGGVDLGLEVYGGSGYTHTRSSTGNRHAFEEETEAGVKLSVDIKF